MDIDGGTGYEGILLILLILLAVVVIVILRLVGIL